MAELLVGPLLRYVSTTAATIWVGHHYALVVLDGLESGSVTTYDVRLDDRSVWPLPGSTPPPSVIRTLHDDGRPVTMAFGSCRAVGPDAAPEPGGGRPPARHDVDALRALGARMLTQEPSAWPDLLVLLGDQVYADDPSPGAAARMAEAPRPPGIPDELVADFEQYTWLYGEAWTPEVERWLLSVVPSAMIFDDHDMIDDWNISAAWIAEIRTEPWWREHVIGGIVSYWIYQHLGNLSPERIAEEGLLAAVVDAGDATDLLREWALESERFTPVPGGYQFSFDRHLADIHVVIVDARNGRVLEPGARPMVDDDEWAWVRDRALEPCGHLVLATSLPVFVPGGLHGLQQWNEAMCDGERGRWLRRPSEWLRRALDLEDWPAFDHTFRRFERLLADVGTPGDGRTPPHTISILSGDIHFAYVADVAVPDAVSTVRQVVCSPLRNSLSRRDRNVMRFGVSRVGRRLGRALAAWARRGPSLSTWELVAPPIFENNLGELRADGPRLDVVVHHVVPDDGGRLEPVLTRP